MVSDIAHPVNGEAKVREVVDAHKDWRVFATDYFKDDKEGPVVIFYIETKAAKTFTDVDGVKRVAKPMFIEHFKTPRVAREPESVGRQLLNTANTRLLENMRNVDRK